MRTLRERMDGMLFERTAISKQPDALIHRELTQMQQQPSGASPALFLKDPYLLDFLDLKDNFTETTKGKWSFTLNGLPNTSNRKANNLPQWR